MALTYLGSLTIAAINPGLPLALASAIPRIQAELAGQLAVIAQINLVPPSIAASLSIATDLVGTITSQIALGVTFPSLGVQVAAAQALILALNIELGALGFDMSAAGIHAYAYAGRADGLGPSLPSALPGGSPGDQANALVLATSIPASWIALGAILKTA